MAAIRLARRAIEFTNEACARTYINPYFMAAIALTPELQLTPEKYISGRWGSGAVDYGIEWRNATGMYVVGITEAKTKKTLSSGFPQNVMQLDAALTTRDAWDPRSNSEPSVCYGIVTDAKYWEFIECRMVPMDATAIIRGPPIVRKAKLPIIVDYNKDTWADDVQEV
ncbi:hypothetical protein BG005_005298, partial [Podila minutissima]